MQKIVYRELNEEEIEKMHDIDRSEIIDIIYSYENNVLIEKKVNYNMTGFPENELNIIIARQRKILNEDGKIIGAFADSLLVGIVSVENKIRGKRNKYCKMDILHVSNKYRKQGIATMLVNECKSIAKTFGADRLYISATESKNTIEFYQNRGAVLVEELDEELFKLEPEDIHLEIIL